jgi:hypothetical protein
MDVASENSKNFNFIRVCKGFLKAFRLNFPLNLDECFDGIIACIEPLAVEPTAHTKDCINKGDSNHRRVPEVNFEHSFMS